MVLEKTLESPLDSKEIKQVNPKGNQPWIFTERTDAETEAPILLQRTDSLEKKKPWYWERLRAGGEGSVRGWDGWMASPTQRTWVWANSRRWWRTGKSDALQSIQSQSRTRQWLNNSSPLDLTQGHHSSEKWWGQRSYGQTVGSQHRQLLPVVWSGRLLALHPSRHCK